MQPKVPNGKKEIANARALGDLVRQVRRSQHLTQAELAGASGVGQRFVNELEGGKPTCEFDKALKVARMLGIKLVAQPPELE